MNPIISKTKREIPDIRTGDIVRVLQKIKEGGKDREQSFEGVVIKRSSGSGPNASFVVRKISQGVGVERKFLLQSPLLTKITVKKRTKVKRAYLSYLRNSAQLIKNLKDQKVEPFEAILVKEVKKTEKEEQIEGNQPSFNQLDQSKDEKNIEKTKNVENIKESIKSAKEEPKKEE